MAISSQQRRYFPFIRHGCSSSPPAAFHSIFLDHRTAEVPARRIAGAAMTIGPMTLPAQRQHCR